MLLSVYSLSVESYLYDQVQDGASTYVGFGYFHGWVMFCSSTLPVRALRVR